MQRKSETRRIEFELLGIGTLLSRARFKVPLNQREYAWEEKQVSEFFDDIKNASSKQQTSYFLGTILLTSGEIPLIADGQQRLATATMLLAAIRDWFFLHDEFKDADSIDQDFLNIYDRSIRGDAPRLTLNLQDREFFSKFVLSLPNTEERNIQPAKDSHFRIRDAALYLRNRIEKEVATTSKKDLQIDILLNWVNYLENNAEVVVFQVKDELNAFVMFETMNDRGLRTSQADLVKNYLFDKADERGQIDVAQMYWENITSKLEAVESEELLIPFLRHLLGALYELTREKDVFIRVKENAQNNTQALTLLDKMSLYSQEYVAILNPNASKWNDYNPRIRRHIRTIVEILQVEQIRPVMMAVAKHFEKKEAEKAFRLFVNWSVRFLIAGGGPSGKLEKAYTDSAWKITHGSITTTEELYKELSGDIPNDAIFKERFEIATVPKTHLARYYLRALELTKKGFSEPELVPNEDTVITAEHILPRHPDLKDWSEIDLDVAKSIHNRLGNYVLLQASQNGALSNKGFDKKVETFKASPYLLTNMVAKYSKWGKDEIVERQKELAELAVNTWTIK